MGQNIGFRGLLLFIIVWHVSIYISISHLNGKRKIIDSFECHFQKRYQTAQPGGSVYIYIDIIFFIYIYIHIFYCYQFLIYIYKYNGYHVLIYIYTLFIHVYIHQIYHLPLQKCFFRGTSVTSRISITSPVGVGLHHRSCMASLGVDRH